MTLGGTYSWLYSNVLSEIARDACRADMRRPHDPLIAIVFSAFYVEATVNELIHGIQIAPGVDLGDGTPIAKLSMIIEAAELGGRRANLMAKVQLISAALRGRLFDEGTIEDLNLLLSLRNTIAHNRPESLTITWSEGRRAWKKELNELYKGLIKRRVVPGPPRVEHPSDFPPLVDALGQRETAVWGYNTAQSFAQELSDMLPDEWRGRVFVGHDFSRLTL